MKADDRPGLRQRARRAGGWGKNKYTGSWAEYLWQRLDAAVSITASDAPAASSVL